MHITHDPNAAAAEAISFSDFAKIDIRLGTIRECTFFPQARNSSYILLIDFGATIGIRKSAAQITRRYVPEDLVGQRVMAVVNFPPKQIGPMRSEVLVLGFADPDGAVVLATSEATVPDGARLA
ncbi:MAG: tRNA-binding protein [Caulobacteraceae bacterium]